MWTFVMIGCLLLAVGCNVQKPSSDLATTVTNQPPRQGRALQGVSVSIDQKDWDVFIQSRCVLNVDGNLEFKVNGKHFDDQQPAFDAVKEQISRQDSRGVIAFYSKRSTDGCMSIKSVEQLCKEKNVDCLRHGAVGGFYVSLPGSKPPPEVDLDWTIVAGQTLAGVRVTVDEASLEEFVRPRCVIRLDGDDEIEVNGQASDDQQLAFDAVKEQISQQHSRGVIVFCSKRQPAGRMSIASIQQLCREHEVDCLMNFAIGDGVLVPVGSEPSPGVGLDWRIEASGAR